MSKLTKVLGTVALEPKGDYDANEYYEKLNTVSYNGSTFMATKASHNVLPTNSEYWQFIGGGISSGDIVDNLKSTSSTKVLSANQGRKLNNIKPSVYNNIEEMKADLELSYGMVAKTLGYYNENDGGNAEYIIDNNQELVEDGGTVHELDNGLKAVLLIKNDIINVKQFGAKGDNENDDTQAIQNAINNGNKKTVFIPSGTYLVSTITINNTMSLKGTSFYSTMIKSIAENVENSILVLHNNGLMRTEISNLWINGNKNSNIGTSINGVKLYCDDINSDKFTNIHDLRVTNCTGYGIYIERNLTSNDIREIRLTNIDIGTCEKDGLFADSCTDSFFDKISSHSNLKSGFVFKGGNNKINNCKAFWNGNSEEEEENTYRLPSSAFSQTTDTSYVSGKTYYERNGDGTQNKWYYYTEFEGSEFVEGNVYYELTTEYKKKYPGFSIESSRNMITGCEAQDNYGDGFYIYGSFNVMTGIIADNNGLITVNGIPVSYASQNKEQLYYGIYGRNFNSLNVTGNFTNYRYNSVGKHQKAPIFIYNSSYLTTQILSNNQVLDYIMCLGANLNTIVGKCNNKEFRYEYDVTKIPLGDANLYIYTSDADSASYLYKENNIVYYKFIVKDNNGVLRNTNDRELLVLPSEFRPSNIIFKLAYLTNSSGYTKTADCIQTIYKSGSVRGRITETGHTTDVGIVLEGSFPVEL